MKNAIRTYELYPSLDPFKVKDLLKAHGVMMEALIDDAGRFRSGGVGVFEGERCVHLAPPAQRVPELMGDLFEWLKKSKDHLLIRSCVFHFEFESIHPFSDGNGRTGRLWQSLILGRLHPLFEHLPEENIVYSNQQQYYEAIGESTRRADSGPFIDFMLGEILKTLKNHQDEPLHENNVEEEFGAKFGKEFGVKFGVKFGANEKRVLLILDSNPAVSANEIAEQIGLSQRGVEKQLKKFRDLGIITRKGSDKNGLWVVTKQR